MGAKTDLLPVHLLPVHLLPVHLLLASRARLARFGVPARCQGPVNRDAAHRKSVFQKAGHNSFGLRLIRLLAGCAVLIAPGACATAERLLPAGFIKQEDIARDIPVNPTIAATIEQQNEGRRAQFPILAEQPGRGPTGLSAGEQSAWENALVRAREELNAEIAADRARAEADQAEALDDKAAATNAAARRDREAVARDRADAIVPPR